MSGRGKQKALARHLESQLEVEGSEPTVEFGCTCRTLHCDPRPVVGALILRITNKRCPIHGPRDYLFELSKMSASQLLGHLSK